MFEPFQKFFARTANHYGIATEIEAAQICHSFRELIPKLFKDEKSSVENITSASFKKKTLYVNVKNSAWAQEVIMRKEKIIEEMNAKAGKKVIENLLTHIST